jgi:carboxyl-terminal processing protease
MITVSAGSVAPAQIASKPDREAGREMLEKIRLDLEKYYYDPTYRGIDLDAKFKTANEQIAQAKSLGEIFSLVAQVLVDFGDSHLSFSPPRLATSVRYGWRMQVIGDKCFVTAVEPKSDAEKKGLKRGDQIVAVNGFRPTRENFWKLQYVYYILRPQTSVELTIRNSSGRYGELVIATKVVSKSMVADSLHNLRFRQILEYEAAVELRRDRFIDLGRDLTIWKMPAFDDFDNEQVDSMVAHAKKFKSLIIDLRGNGGGYVVTLQRLVANLMDHDLKLFDEKGRKETTSVRVTSRKREAFTGPVILLVDSRSASAAELLARVVQLEKRGLVIGDQTSGAVMESRHFPHDLGVVSGARYGVSVTVADVIMSDGKSLEGTGVIPDELLLPTAADLAAGRDPVLARAAALAGVVITPEQAGTFFPAEWPK